MKLIRETKKRTIIKSILWRVVATLNSWMILSVIINGENIVKAIIMNVTGFFIFYFFERIWSKIRYGRIIINDDSELPE